jgi:hypothetical protein
MPTATGPGQISKAHRQPARRKTRISLLLAVTLVLANLLAIAPVAAQATAPFATASLVPADALLYTVVPLVDNEEQWQQGMTLLRRAGLGAEFDALTAEILGAESEDEASVELFLGGEVAMVVTDTAMDILADQIAGDASGATAAPTYSESGLAFLITAESPTFVALAIESAIAGTAEELGVEVEQTQYDGVTINYVSVPDGSEETPMATARIGDIVLAAGFPSDLEPLIETSNGDRAPLAELDAFGEARAALDQDYLLFGYLNPPPTDILEQALSEAGLPVTMPESTFAPTGFLVAADEPGFRLETVSIGTGSATANTTNLADSQLVTTTPDDALILFSGLDLAGTGILDIAASLILGASGLVPPSATPVPSDEVLASQFEELARIVGVNFRTDLLLQLTGAYGFWAELDPESGNVTTLFTSEVDDVEAVSGALFQVTLLAQSAGSGQMTVTTRPVGETDRVFSILTGDATVPRVEYGILGETMVIGLGEAVDAYADGPESPLAGSESFDVVMSALPEATTGLMYIDLEQAIPLLSTAADETGVDDLAADITGDADDEATFSAQPAATREGDAHPDCARFETQAEAQAAYDAFAPGTFQLDEDFDGEACEDFFTQSDEPIATPEPSSAAPVTEMTSFTAFGMVAFDEDGNSRTSSLLLVTEPEE